MTLGRAGRELFVVAKEEFHRGHGRGSTKVEAGPAPWPWWLFTPVINKQRGRVAVLFGVIDPDSQEKNQAASTQWRSGGICLECGGFPGAVIKFKGKLQQPSSGRTLLLAQVL